MDAICAEEMDEITKCKPECDQSSYEAKTKYYSQIGMFTNFLYKWTVIEWSIRIFSFRNALSDLLATYPGTENTTSSSNDVWIKLKTPEITVYEEYVVYTFSGILGSVGGSMGLFIGFSLIEFLLFFVRWACNMSWAGRLC